MVKVKNIFRIFLFFILIQVVAKAQSNSEMALMKGGWTGGLAGILGWDNFKEEIADSGTFDVDGFRFIIDSRNGKIVETNVAFGFDIQWDERNRTITPRDNPSNRREYQKRRLYFIGLWFRYYLLNGRSNWVLFPDISAGYGNYKSVLELIDDIEPNTKSVSSADGIAYNLGFGVAHFLSPTVSFDLTVRWQGGNLTGEAENTDGTKKDLTLKLSSVNVLIGFQVYLR